MNATVNKLFDIWGDLDSSYEKYKSKLNVSSKSEYIKKLCLDKNGNELFTKTLRYNLLETLIPHINNSIQFFINKMDQ